VSVTLDSGSPDLDLNCTAYSCVGLCKPHSATFRHLSLEVPSELKKML